jgi:hypothetical protein
MDELDPSVICAELGLCSKQLHSIKGEECDTCKDVAEYLAVYLDNNATEAKVKAVLEKLCEMFPIFKDMCDEGLANFDLFWDLVRGEVDKDTFCYQLGLCARGERCVGTSL